MSAARDRSGSGGYRRHLGRGFNWLGGATVTARVIDALTILVVLLFLTKQEVGLASLVVSLGTVIEAADGLGTGDALVQAESVSRLQLDSLFWFIIASAVTVAGLTLLAAPWIEALYGAGGMATYFLAIAAKQPLVGAALIPLAMMNRGLRYERIAVVNVGATLGAALTRLGLAAGGAGAWALVGGYVASGLYTLIGAQLAHPFRPRVRFRLGAIRPLVRFGLRAAAAQLFEQGLRNIDYLLVGWFYGTAQLAIYRVAFAVAMEPAMAVSSLVNRTALPVFARIASLREEFVPALTWSLGRIETLVAPLMAGVMLAAVPLAALLHDGAGNSYAAAAVPLRILAAAALLRVVSQVISPVMIGSGHPGTAARLSAATLVLLGGGILAVGLLVPAASGVVAVAAVWLGVYPPLLVWAACYLRRHWHIALGQLARTLVLPLAGIAITAALVTGSRLALGAVGARVEVGIIAAAVALTYAALLLLGRRLRTAAGAEGAATATAAAPPRQADSPS